MINLGIGIPFTRRSGGGGSGFDPDYQAILTYANSLSYTLPSAGQQVIQNQLMIDLKIAGIWNKLDSFRVYATDGSANFALIDWKRLVLCTAVNAPVFTTNVGYQGDGISSYIDSNYNPSTDAVNYALNSASIFSYVSTVQTVGQSQAYMGAFTGTSWLIISAGIPALGESYINSTSGVANAVSGLGFQLATRTDANTLKVFYNGILRNTNSSAASAATLPSVTAWDFACNNGSSGTFFANQKTSVIGYGANLEAEQSNFNTIINTYINAI